VFFTDGVLLTMKVRGREMLLPALLCKHWV